MLFIIINKIYLETKFFIFTKKEDFCTKIEITF